jgi:cyclic beta-1,2-glucan synthetase
MLVETDSSASRLRSHPKGALITPLRRLLGDTGPHSPWEDSAPIRAELFSVERLEEHARSLAAARAAIRSFFRLQGRSIDNEHLSVLSGA